MHRFFIDKQNINNDSIKLEGQDVAHIRTVLRLSAGEPLELCDGQGYDYQARIRAVNKDWVDLHIESAQPSGAEPRTQITLYQAIPKADKMDDIVQKCVELGVHKIVPVITVRTVVRLYTPQDAQKKAQRWRRIALEAAKQSRRGIIPDVALPVKLKSVLQDAQQSFGIIASEHEERTSLKGALEGLGENIRDFAVMVGPEGGWEHGEVVATTEAGWTPVTLGPRILRTETVAAAVISAIMFFTEECNGRTSS